MKPNISLKKAFLNDYALFVLSIVPCTFSVIALFSMAVGILPNRRLRGAEGIDPQSGFAIGILLFVLSGVALVFARRRYNLIRDRLEHGIDREATITHFWLKGDKGRIDFEYTYDGNTYTTGTPIMKNKTTENFSVGDTLAIKVDPNNPNNAVIPALYLDS